MSQPNSPSIADISDVINVHTERLILAPQLKEVPRPHVDAMCINYWNKSIGLSMQGVVTPTEPTWFREYMDEQSNPLWFNFPDLGVLTIIEGVQ